MYFYDFQTIYILLIPHSHVDTLQAEHGLPSSPHTQHCNSQYTQHCNSQHTQPLALWL